MKTLLIGFLYAGECQYEDAKASLARQDMQDYDVFVLENMPNQKAMETLYRTFMANSADYRYFLKFDADFVLRHPDVLSRIVARFDRPQTACVSVHVQDWLSGLSISGMHTYRHDTMWDIKPAEALFVDHGEQLRGEKVFLRGLDWVDHNREPGPYQAFRFGIHRASKSLQPDRPKAERLLNQGAMQHALLQAIGRKFVQEGRHPSRLWALLGVEVMYRATDRRIMDYTGPYVRALFGSLRQEPLEPHAQKIAEFWRYEMETAARWSRAFLRQRVLS